MRFILILLLLPLFSSAQINRSAKELATENIGAYLKKVYKNQSYHLVSLGEPQLTRSKTTQLEWTIYCQVNIDRRTRNATNDPALATSNFKFYLNKKMEVLSAETYTIE